MIIECCSQERSYQKFYGLLAERFCNVAPEFQRSFEGLFKSQYDTVHRLETNKLRNVARLFGHILVSDALPWTVFEHVRLTEADTNSSSRIFLKVLCVACSVAQPAPGARALTPSPAPHRAGSSSSPATWASPHFWNGSTTRTWVPCSPACSRRTRNATRASPSTTLPPSASVR